MHFNHRIIIFCFLVAISITYNIKHTFAQKVNTGPATGKIVMPGMPGGQEKKVQTMPKVESEIQTNEQIRSTKAIQYLMPTWYRNSLRGVNIRPAEGGKLDKGKETKGINIPEVKIPILEQQTGISEKQKESKDGTWLVVSLTQFLQENEGVEEKEGETRKMIFSLEDKIYIQKYDKLAEKIFALIEDKASIEDRGYTHKLILKQNGAFDEEYFSTMETIFYDNWMYEQSENGEFNVRISDGGAYLKPKKKIIIKVPVKNIALDRYFDLIVEDLKTGEAVKVYGAEEYMPIEEKESSEIIIKEQSALSMLNEYFLRNVEAAEADDCDKLMSLDLAGHENDPNDLNRINIMFLGFSLNVEQVKQLASKLSSSIFYEIPFNTNKNKFNLWYIDKEYIATPPFGARNECSCHLKDYEFVDRGNCGLRNVMYLNMCYMKNICTSHAGGQLLDLGLSKDGLKQMLISPLEKPNTILYHEYGHLFGYIQDEYGFSASNTFYPNCPRDEKEGNKWWGDVFSGLEYYKSCNSATNYRYYDNSFMNAHGGYYGDVHRFHFCTILFKMTGSLDNNYCSSFLNNYPSRFIETEICNDGVDNDLNGFTDCADKNCKGSDNINCELSGNPGSAKCDGGVCKEIICNDNKDNDGDGKIDCVDFSCEGKPGPDGNACPITVEQDCFDKKDNDNDGKIDCNDDDCIDTDCLFPKKCVSEDTCYLWDDTKAAKTGEITCKNGADDDKDLKIDCMDIDCWSASLGYHDYSNIGNDPSNKDFCQGWIWEKDRVLMKQEGDPQDLNNYVLRQCSAPDIDSVPVGEFACGVGKCDHIEVLVLPNQPDSWMPIKSPSIWAGIDCNSTKWDIGKLPEGGGNHAFSAICKEESELDAVEQ